MGASLLVLANKRDLPNSISLEDIGKVHFCRRLTNSRLCRWQRFKRILQKYSLVVRLVAKTCRRV